MIAEEQKKLFLQRRLSKQAPMQVMGQVGFVAGGANFGAPVCHLECTLPAGARNTRMMLTSRTGATGVTPKALRRGMEGWTTWQRWKGDYCE
jgi:hypothetical protein